MIRSRTEPAKGISRVQVRKWITDLGHDRFAMREVASASLLTVGVAYIPFLRAELTAKLSPEARERLERVIEKLALEAVPAAEIRAPRVVEVLERIGTNEARAVLERLATGSKDATLTVEATAAFGRLGGKR